MHENDQYHQMDQGQILALVRQAVEFYVLYREVIDVSLEKLKGMERPRGAFVSIKKEGELRGCIGTIKPTQPNLVREIISNAISAAFKDPRFSPVREEELPLLSYSVDILSPLEEVQVQDLDPHRYGIFVEKGPKRGLLLPDLPDIHTVERQIHLVCQKAGISSRKGMKIYRFTVHRLSEQEDR